MLALCCILLRRRQEIYQYRAWAVVSLSRIQAFGDALEKDNKQQRHAFFVHN